MNSFLTARQDALWLDRRLKEHIAAIADAIIEACSHPHADPDVN